AAAARLPDQGRGAVEGAGSRRPRHSAVRDRPMSNIEGPHIEGIDRITYGVEDLAACKRFFLDWGLRLVREEPTGLDFESLNGCEIRIRKSDDPSLPPAVEAGPTLREVVWGVRPGADLDVIRPHLSGQPSFRE